LGPSLLEGAFPNQDKLLGHFWKFMNWILSDENGGSLQGFSGCAISLSIKHSIVAWSIQQP